MTAIKERGEIDFSEAGDGFVLRFTNRDLIELETEFGKSFLQEKMQRMMEFGENDVAFLERAARVGLKKDGKKVDPIPDDAFDTLIVVEFAKRVIDGLFTSIHGKKFEDYLREQAELVAKLKEEGKDPPPSSPDMTTLEISENDPSGQESASMSSGTTAPVK